MTSATAELTDSGLDAMAAENLREMDETPPPIIRPPQPQDDGPLSWNHRGGWNFANYTPASLGVDGAGCLKLALSLQSTRPPQRGELSGLADQQVSAARAGVLATLQNDPVWQQYLDAKAEYSSTRNTLDSLDAQTRTLEEERLRLAARPKGCGPRLAVIAQEQDALSTRRNAAQLELDALRPILDSARQRAEQLAKQYASETARNSREGFQDDLDRALSDFYQRHSEELTTLASHLHARRARNHAGWVAELERFALSSLERAEPIAEPAGV